MVTQKEKGKYIGMAGALVVHVAIIALLILVGFTVPASLGRRRYACYAGRGARCMGAADPSLVEVDVMPEEAEPLRRKRWSRT